MPSQSIILPKLVPRSAAIKRIADVLSVLQLEKAWLVEISEHKAKRSDSQNRFLWSIYTEILEKGGEDMGGWTKQDLHDFFLINHFGSETKNMFGRKRLVALRTSSNLSKMEFVDYVDSILRFMAQRGVYIRSPEEYFTEFVA